MRVFIIVMLLVAGATASPQARRNCREISWTQHPRDCEELYEFSNHTCPNAKYLIYPEGTTAHIYVECDMRGGAWTVFLKRRPRINTDEIENFNLDLTQMKFTVGRSIRQSFIGLIPLHRLTSSGTYWLMAELWAQGEKRVSIHEGFSVAGETTNFTLTSGTFRSDKSNVSADALLRSNGMQFSVYSGYFAFGDCNYFMQGPGWFNDCSRPWSMFGETVLNPDWNPFGPYSYTPGVLDKGQLSVWWNYFDGYNARSLKGLVLKLRRTAP